MALSYQQTITTSQGDTITASAADGDFIKLSLSASGMALLQADVQNFIALLQGLAQAKAADARFALIAKK